MKTKRILATLLAAAMCLSLVSCGKNKTPTAEELLADGGLGGATSVDLTMDLSFASQISMEALMGEGAGKMEMGVTAHINLLQSEEASHTKGTVGLSLLGMEYSEDMESYTVNGADNTVTTYTKSADDGTWTYAIGEETSEQVDIKAMSSLDASIFTDLQMQPVEKKDTVYVVTGKVNVDDMMDKTGVDAGDMLGTESIGEDAMRGAKFDATLTYDRDTKRLKSLKLVLDPSSVDSEDMEISVFELEVSVNGINDVDVNVPSDVLESAKEEATIFGDGGADVDFGGFAGDDGYIPNP